MFGEAALLRLRKVGEIGSGPAGDCRFRRNGKLPVVSPNQRSVGQLDPKVLAKIHALEIRARLVVEGFFSGMHPSPQRGISIEFADYRAYVQGDDLRHIDWKVFGRTDKYYVKEYEQETNLELILGVDCSESMGYRSAPDGLSKYEYAATLAAAIAYLALQQQDAVGLALFDERIRRLLPPSNNPNHWRILVEELSGRVGPAKTSVAAVLSELAERLDRRSLVILISDLFDDPDTMVRGFQLLRFRHHELIVWNLWDQAEQTFPFNSPTRFEGLEAAESMLLEPVFVRARYLEEIGRFLKRMQRECARMHIDFEIFNTSSPLDAALTNYLATRSGRLRRGAARSRR